MKQTNLKAIKVLINSLSYNLITSFQSSTRISFYSWIVNTDRRVSQEIYINEEWVIFNQKRRYKSLWSETSQPIFFFATDGKGWFLKHALVKSAN